MTVRKYKAYLITTFFFFFMNQIYSYEEFSIVKHVLFSKMLGSLIKQATFLGQGRKPEVNVSHASTVVSPRFSN